MKTLLPLFPILCMLLIASNMLGALIEIDQLTLKGEYLDPAGHPGIPHEPLPSNITVWEEIIFRDVFPNVPYYECSLYAQDADEPVLLDRYSGYSQGPAYEWTADGDRITWTRYGLPTIQNWRSFYANGEIFSFVFDESLTMMGAYGQAFGSNFFVTWTTNMIWNIPGVVDWSHATMDVRIVLLDSMQYFTANRLSIQNLLGDCAVPESHIYPTVYANGIDIAQDWSYPGCDDAEIYTEHFWIEVSEPVMINLDIKPQSCPNPFNVKSKGLLPVAIPGSETVDVNDIDIDSIQLAGVSPIRSSYEDVATPLVDPNECECSTEGPDGYIDLTLKFETQAIADALGEVADGDEFILYLTGYLYDGTPIEGSDCIIIRRKGRE